MTGTNSTDLSVIRELSVQTEKIALFHVKEAFLIVEYERAQQLDVFGIFKLTMLVTCIDIDTGKLVRRSTVQGLGEGHGTFHISKYCFTSGTRSKYEGNAVRDEGWCPTTGVVKHSIVFDLMFEEDIKYP